ncbi:MAG: acyl carrier protein [Actinomycetota bacterium]
MTSSDSTTDTSSAGSDPALARELAAFIESEVSQVDAPIEPDTDLLLSGAVDSLGVMVIVDWIERRQGIRIDPGDVVLEHFQSVSAMLGYLDAR